MIVEGVPCTVMGTVFRSQMADYYTELLSLAKHLGRRRLLPEDLSKALPEGNLIEWSSDLSILRPASSSVEKTFGPITPSGVDLRRGRSPIKRHRKSLKLVNQFTVLVEGESPFGLEGVSLLPLPQEIKSHSIPPHKCGIAPTLPSSRF